MVFHSVPFHVPSALHSTKKPHTCEHRSPLQAKNPQAVISPPIYPDYPNTLGTDLVQTMLAAALAQAGKTVLHLDENPWYSPLVVALGEWPLV